MEMNQKAELDGVPFTDAWRDVGREAELVGHALKLLHADVRATAIAAVRRSPRMIPQERVNSTNSTPIH